MHATRNGSENCSHCARSFCVLGFRWCVRVGHEIAYGAHSHTQHSRGQQSFEFGLLTIKLSTIYALTHTGHWLHPHDRSASTNGKHTVGIPDQQNARTAQTTNSTNNEFFLFCEQKIIIITQSEKQVVLGPKMIYGWLFSVCTFVVVCENVRLTFSLCVFRFRVFVSVLYRQFRRFLFTSTWKTATQQTSGNAKFSLCFFSVLVSRSNCTLSLFVCVRFFFVGILFQFLSLCEPWRVSPGYFAKIVCFLREHICSLLIRTELVRRENNLPDTNGRAQNGPKRRFGNKTSLRRIQV